MLIFDGFSMKLLDFSVQKLLYNRVWSICKVVVGNGFSTFLLQSTFHFCDTCNEFWWFVFWDVSISFLIPLAGVCDPEIVENPLQNEAFQKSMKNH